MAGAGAVPIHVAVSSEFCIIQPEGPCTVLICETIDAAVQQWLRDEIRDIYFDLSRVEWLDSTFTGYLVSLVTRENSGRATIHLANPIEAVRQSLAAMHVESLFDICSSLPESTRPWQDLEVVHAAPSISSQRVLDSHQRLINADARNEPVFGPVIKLFSTSSGCDGKSGGSNKPGSDHETSA